MGKAKATQLNVCVLQGRLGRDPELQYTSNGKAFIDTVLAHDVGWGDRKHTAWTDFKFWGERAEKVHAYLRKGLIVTITGEIDYDEWADKNTGAKRKKMYINCNNLQINEYSDDGDEPRRAPQTPPAPTQHDTAKANGYAPPQPEDDIPF